MSIIWSALVSQISITYQKLLKYLYPCFWITMCSFLSPPARLPLFFLPPFSASFPSAISFIEILLPSISFPFYFPSPFLHNPFSFSSSSSPNYSCFSCKNFTLTFILIFKHIIHSHDWKFKRYKKYTAKHLPLISIFQLLSYPFSKNS